jgi:hypothetical protein
MRTSHENEIKTKDSLIREKEKEIQSAKSEIDRISRERDSAVTHLAVMFPSHIFAFL